MRIGIISDTHGKLDPLVVEHFAGVDHILHGGDIGGEAVVRALAEIAPLTAVAGNIDGFRCGDAGVEARVTLGGLAFYLIHILDRPQQLSEPVREALGRQRADVVIFGHSHLPHNEKRDGMWFFNPASAGRRRFDYPRAIGIFEKKRGAWTARHIPLDARSEVALGKYMNALSRRRR